MRKPNFFIIGAPKCGTTSMASWLSEHPRIFISPVKEPFFFNTDDNARVRFTPGEYADLFQGAGEHDIAVGEASTWYLHSVAAVPAIEEYSPGAKYVVMIRNPVDMAYSLHEQEIFSGQEDEPRFERAWDLQERRASGLDIPRGCIEPKRLQYGWACSLGTHLQRLLARVPADRVHVIVMDDLRVDALAEYRRVLAFLGVPDDGRSSFPVRNSAKRMRSRLLQRILRLGTATKKRIGVYRSFNLSRLNSVPHSRPPLQASTRRLLQKYFSHEIHLLENLIGRDLRSWRGTE